MNEQKELKVMKWVAWCGPVYIVMFGIAWVWLGHNFPPPAPAYTAQELLDNYYIKYKSDIQLGMCLSTLFGILYIPFVCLVAVLMKRREKSGLLALISLVGGVLTGWVLIMSPAMWAYCAELAGTNVDPEIIKTTHIVAWYFFDMTTMITTIECVAMGVFCLLDDQKPALFPRWLGWWSVIAGCSMFPMCFLPYFKTGPFAFNGAWTWWTVVHLWGFYFIFATYFVFKELKRAPIKASPGIGQAISHTA